MSDVTKLEQALYDFDEVAKDIIGLDYFLVNPFLQTALNGRMAGNTINLATLASNRPVQELKDFFTNDNTLLIEPFADVEFLLDRENKQDVIKFTYQGVKFGLQLIENKYSFFTHPDTFQYQSLGDTLYHFYAVPNPLEDYLSYQGRIL